MTNNDLLVYAIRDKQTVHTDLNIDRNENHLECGVDILRLGGND